MEESNEANEQPAIHLRSEGQNSSVPHLARFTPSIPRESRLLSREAQVCRHKTQIHVYSTGTSVQLLQISVGITTGTYTCRQKLAVNTSMQETKARKHSLYRHMRRLREPRDLFRLVFQSRPKSSGYKSSECKKATSKRHR